MPWFTAKDAPSDEPVRGKTISDKDWQDLQSRAGRAGSVPKFGSRAQVEGTRRGEANYRNRHRN